MRVTRVRNFFVGGTAFALSPVHKKSNESWKNAKLNQNQIKLASIQHKNLVKMIMRCHCIVDALFFCFLTTKRSLMCATCIRGTILSIYWLTLSRITFFSLIGILLPFQPKYFVAVCFITVLSPSNLYDSKSCACIEN